MTTVDDRLHLVREKIQKAPNVLSSEEKKQEIANILLGLTRPEIEELAQKTWELEDATQAPIEKSNLMEVAIHMLTHPWISGWTEPNNGWNNNWWSNDWQEPTAEDDFKKGKHPFDKDKDETEKQKEKLKDKQKYKITGIVSRGVKDRMPLDSNNLGEKYPEQFNFKTDQEIAMWLITSPEGKKVMAEDHIITALQNREITQSEAINLVLKELKEERAKRASPNNQERIKHFLDTSFSAIAKVFKTYDPTHNPLPAKETIHFVDKKEFFGQKGGQYSPGAGGVCFIESGQIFVNMDSIKNKPQEAIAETIKHIITHEVTHGTSSINYRNIGFEEVNGAQNNEHIMRRSWLSFLKPKFEGNKISFIERGRGITEAITEKLAIQALQTIYGTNNMPTTFEAYPAEREVLDLISEILKIPFAYFAAASLDRRQLRKLAELINGKTTKNWKTTYTRPWLFSKILTIMDEEFEANKEQYPKTRQLIMQYALALK